MKFMLAWFTLCWNPIHEVGLPVERRQNREWLFARPRCKPDKGGGALSGRSDGFEKRRGGLAIGGEAVLRQFF